MSRDKRARLARDMPGGLTASRGLRYELRVAALEDLKALGAPVDDAIATARFISGLALTGQQRARLLREYLSQVRVRLSREILIEARDYSFFL